MVRLFGRRQQEPAGPVEPPVDPAVQARQQQAADIASRRPGRPAAGAHERTKRIGISVSQAEHAELTAAAEEAGRGQLARWCREAALAQARGHGPVSSGGGQLPGQLARIGNNLNQLTRAVNQGAVAGSPADGRLLADQLRAMHRQVEKLWEVIE